MPKIGQDIQFNLRWLLIEIGHNVSCFDGGNGFVHLENTFKTIYKIDPRMKRVKRSKPKASTNNTGDATANHEILTIPVSLKIARKMLMATAGQNRSILMLYLVLDIGLLFMRIWRAQRESNPQPQT